MHQLLRLSRKSAIISDKKLVSLDSFVQFRVNKKIVLIFFACRFHSVAFKIEVLQVEFFKLHVEQFEIQSLVMHVHVLFLYR